MFSSNKKQTRGKEIITAMILFLIGCGVPPEDWTDTKPKWIMATKYLPREQLQGLQNAGFFEIGNKICFLFLDLNYEICILKFGRSTFDHPYYSVCKSLYQTKVVRRLICILLVK